MRWPKILIAVYFAVLAAPTPAQEMTCAEPLKPMLRAEMFFGRNIGGRPGVTDAQWARFLARELAPRFPDGLTVIDGHGRWRDPTGGKTVSEPSKIVIAVAPDEAGTRERIAEAAAAYKQRFKQKSVGIVTRTVCAAF